jgi:phage head maturation protease
MLNSITSKEFRQKIEKSESLTDLKVAKDGYQFHFTDNPSILKFVFSSKVVDLNGDRVFPKGIDTQTYTTRNPLILLHHETHSFPIGKTLDLQVINDELIGTVQFFTDLDEAGVGSNARAAVELIKRGTMGLSITFIPKEFSLNATDGVDFQRCLLVETSVVSVPCNPAAYLVNNELDLTDATARTQLEADMANVRSKQANARYRAITQSY